MNQSSYEKAQAIQENETRELLNKLVEELAPLAHLITFKRNGSKTVKTEKLIAPVLEKFKGVNNLRWISIKQAEHSNYFYIEVSFSGSYKKSDDNYIAIYTSARAYSNTPKEGELFNLDTALEQPYTLLDIEGIDEARRRAKAIESEINALIEEANSLRTKHGLTYKSISSIWIN